MTQYYPTATEIYNSLIQDQITNNKGEITFDFLNISIKINEKSAVGDLFQEWFAEWMRQRKIKFRIKQNTQEFPDFLLDENSDTTGLLEIKAFYSSPNFDVANFEAYCDSLTKQAYRLNADYLIFKYDLSNYKFQIKELWLKKIWEITGKSEKYPIRCQPKRGFIYNIRPVTWYSKQSKYKPFQSRLDFVIALYDTLMQSDRKQNDSYDWLEKVKNNYFEHTQEEL